MFACKSAVTIAVYCCGCPGGPSLSLRPCRLPTSSRPSPSSVPVTALTPQEGRRRCHCHCRRLSAVQVVSLSSVPADHGGRCRRRRLSLLHRKSSSSSSSSEPAAQGGCGFRHRCLSLLHRGRVVVVAVAIACLCCTGGRRRRCECPQC